MESLENKKYYKWISGPDNGNIEVYLAEDETGRVWFESGNSVLKDSMDSVMLESTESEYTYSLSINKANEDVFSKYEKLVNDPIPIDNKPVEKEKSAVKIIIEKQKKLNEIDLSISIPVKLPNEKAIEFMTVMFDEDEVIEEITEFVKEQVTNEVILEMIKKSIKQRVSVCSTSEDE